jgi:murein DD-endopeptidase MepM/ murein hydrolase activator NlpD
MKARGRNSGLRLVRGLPATGPAGTERPARRGPTLFLFLPGRETPQRVRLPVPLLGVGLLILIGLGLGGLALWQHNQALEAELAALRQTQALADTREGELHTVVGLQKDELAGQAVQLQSQDAQITGIADDLAELKDRMAMLDRHNAQLREVLGLDQTADPSGGQDSGLVSNDPSPAPTPTPSATPPGPSGRAPGSPAGLASFRTDNGPPSAAPAAGSPNAEAIRRQLTEYEQEIAVLRTAINRREQAEHALDGPTARQVEEWATAADEQPAGADSPEVAAALAEAAQAAAPPAAPPAAENNSPAQPTTRSSIPAGLPFYGRITSPFGWRVSPFIAGARTYHKGMDIACPLGTPVHATQAGRVIVAGWTDTYGITVMIDHGKGWTTIYGHNSKLKVKVGQVVDQGQLISLSGSTGPSTGPHIHYEVRHNGVPVNPANYR